jgi:hypothetical protein
MGDKEVTNTFYAKFSGAYTQSDITALAESVDAWVASDLLPVVGSSWSYDHTTVRGLTSEADFEATSGVFAGAGALTGVAMPNNVALAIKRGTGMTGRSRRGRVYVAGWMDSMLASDNRAGDAVAGAIAAALNGLSAVVADVDWTEVLISRVVDGVPLEVAVAYTIVEYVVVDLVLDTMRRRIRGAV